MTIIRSVEMFAMLAILAAAPADRAPGSKFRDCPECPEMTVIPPGRFTAPRKVASDGRRDDDPGGFAKTKPAREVSIEQAFAVGSYDVTRAEYATFVARTGRVTTSGCYVWNGDQFIDDRTRDWRNPGFAQTDRDPVVCVSWEDAMAYVQWLNSLVTPGAPGDAGPYRLPSWEEAEYTASGGRETRFSWGDDAPRDHANYGSDQCTPCVPTQAGRDRWLHTSPVGSFAANAFGLYDTAGNVWQWTNGCYTEAPVPPAGACTTFGLQYGVIHGGSWLDKADYLPAREYAVNLRANRNHTTGFRVARSLDPAPAPAAPVATFRDCPGCPEMITIPAGTIEMGRPGPEEVGLVAAPLHRVDIREPFALGVYSVSRDEYALFVRETQRPDVGGCNYNDGRRWTLDPRKNWHNPGFPQTGTDPVVCVSWDDAQAYVAWLNTKVTGASGRYRIPSEAEWEYAARHGAETPFYWGPAASHDLANYGAEDCFPCGVAQAGRDRWDYTSPAGAFPPNGFGLYDMAGNVWQWTADCWNETFINAPRDGSAWTTGECRIRVLRGGSWLDPSMFLSIPTRNRWPPDDHNNANGFRVARSLR